MEQSSPGDQPFVWPSTLALENSAPLRWLGRGFADILGAPLASLFYGLILSGMGFALTRFFGGATGLALTTGFLIAGPFLAVGLYDISRRLEQSQHVALRPTLTAWRINAPGIGFYALILMLSLAIWIRISVVMVAMFIPDQVNSIGELASVLIVNPQMWAVSAIYVAVGAVLAGFAYATSVVALPMLLDRHSMDPISAMIVSVNLLRKNPLPLLLWAAIIVGLTAVGFFLWFIGLAITVPLIGHATWHAYRDSIGD